MNFLAHLHVAKATNTSAVGNLLGDFVKGEVDGLHFNDEIKKGIRLHRAIDSFTDEHELTKSLKSELGEYRRYGGIVLDVFYDHQLASQFELFNPSPLSQFSNEVYKELVLTDEVYPQRFVKVVNSMTEMDWLTGYGDIANIHRALLGISSRLSRPVELGKTVDWYLKNIKCITKEFPTFYEELLEFARSHSK